MSSGRHGGGESSIRARARVVLNYVTANGGNPPPGYTGGRVYRNRSGLLPSGGDYREYDVDPTMPGGGRNAERIVVDLTTGRAWYTSDHYASFVRLR